MPELPPHDWHAPIVRMIVDAYGRSRAPVYVEIGVDRGHTLRTVAPAAAEIHAVDVTFAELGPIADNRIAFHEQTSDAFFASFNGPADVVFVDGDHSMQQVAQDLRNALRVLRRDGMVIVHDTLPLRREWAESHCGDGYKAIEYERHASGVQVFTVPLFPGLSFVSPRPNPIRERK